MKKRVVEVLGFLSGAVTTISFIPQIILIWSNIPIPAETVSLPMYIIFCLGVAGWTVYGVLIKSCPIIVWNIITMLLAIPILIYKCVYG